jgi:hypothetical protein
MMGRAGPLGVDIMRVLYVEGSEGAKEKLAVQVYLDVGSRSMATFNPRC